MYKLSVIIPVYNTLQYLDECVNSVLNQTLKNIEIILVDDESPDGAGKKCDELAKKNKEIKVIHKKNGGLGFARNSGLSVATGEYIAFLDSDDYVDYNYYEAMVDKCEKTHSDLCAAKGFYQCRDNKSKEEVVFVHDGYEVIEGRKIRDTIPRLISRKNDKDDGIWGSACFSIYKRQLIVDNHIQFVSERSFISEDTWFSMDVYYLAKRIVLADIIGYCYRYNEQSLSRSYRANRYDQLISTIKQLRQKCKQMHLSDFEERIALYFWVNFEKCINQEVRYVGKGKGLKNIKKMMQESECRSNLQLLLNERSFNGSHRLLCSLLMNSHYFTVYCLLKIYNFLKHR